MNYSFFIMQTFVFVFFSIIYRMTPKEINDQVLMVLLLTRTAVGWTQKIQWNHGTSDEGPRHCDTLTH